MLNNPKKVPSPGSAALQEALNLIAGLGSGDKNLKSMLEEMKKVQKHNEKVAQEAVDAMSAVRKSKDSLSRDAEEFESNLKSRRQSIEKREKDLDMERVEFEKEKTTYSDTNRKRENDYNKRHGELVNDETELAREIERCAGEKTKNEARSKQLDTRESELFKAEGNLLAIQEYLKSHL
jgi:DNA repair exonuclease SbcCD ATPase subunit